MQSIKQNTVKFSLNRIQKAIIVIVVLVTSLSAVSLAFGWANSFGEPSSTAVQAEIEYEDIFLSANPTWSRSGQDAYDYMGSSVTAIGDINGDGLADAIIRGKETGDLSSGPTYNYIYFGEAGGFSQTPALATADGNFSSAGDVNDDGYDDLLFSKPGVDYVDLYLGSETGISLSSPITLTGITLQESPRSRKAIGDINKDGFGDYIIGYYENAEGGENAGKIAIHLGSETGISQSPVFTATGNSDDMFGFRMSGAGDLNNDGYDDVLVGAPQYLSTHDGYVRVFFGDDSGIDVSQTVTLTSGVAGSQFSRRIISGVGDVNNDGYDDVMVGSQLEDGKIDIFHGSASGIDTTPATTIQYADALGHYLHKGDGAGDVNGDGYDDILLSNDGGYYGSVDNYGRIFIFPGSANGILKTPAFVGASTIVNSPDNYGNSIAGVGDVNGDGRSDILVSAPTTGENGYHSGRVYLYADHQVNINPVPSKTLSGEVGEQFGDSLESADVNGDGYPDLVVSAPNWNDGAGRFQIHYGSATGLNSTPDYIANSSCGMFGEGPEYLGRVLKSAGDIDGDGTDDLVLNAPGGDGCSRDKMFIYYGSSLGISEMDTLTFGNGEYVANLKVSPAGDVNNDGFADVMMSYSGDDSVVSNGGKVLIYHGSASGINPTPARVLTGQAVSEDLGSNISSAGDVNGDEFDDILVSNSIYPEQGVLLFLGSASGIGQSPAWTFASSEGSVGFRVLGDVNGDGFADVAISDSNYDNGNKENVGILNIYYGSSSGLPSTPSTSMEGINVDDRIGQRLVSVGDINNDGYDDFFIGYPNFNSHAVSNGRVELYFGSATGPQLSSDFLVSGSEWGEYVGQSVAAGDVNQDGFVDVFVGAPWINGRMFNEIEEAGKVLVYMGVLEIETPASNSNSIFLPFVTRN